MVFIYFPYYLSGKLIYESSASVGENPSLMLAENLFNVQILFQQTIWVPTKCQALPHELSNLILARNKPLIMFHFSTEDIKFNEVE